MAGKFTAAALSKLLTSLEVINTPLETPIIIVVISQELKEIKSKGWRGNL